MFPFRLARRICTILENELAKNKHLEDLKDIMLKPKYPLEVINKGISKAVAIPQTDLKQPRNGDKSEKILPFITTFLPEQSIGFFYNQDSSPNIV